MKKLLSILTLVIFISAFSQDYSIPPLSPRQKIEQQFSISKITVDYGRPAVKDRKIFGELVPYNQIWRLGANQATVIKFGQDVDFGGKSVKAGIYAMYVSPSEKSWKVILNRGVNNWGAYNYDPKDDVTSFLVPIEPNEKTERFTISFDELEDEKVEMTMKWDLVKVRVYISAQNTEEVRRIIEKLKDIKKIEGDINKKNSKK